MSSSLTSAEMIKFNLVHNTNCLLLMGRNPAMVEEVGMVFLLTLGGPSSAAEHLEFLHQCYVQVIVLKNSHRTFKSSVEVK